MHLDHDDMQRELGTALRKELDPAMSAADVHDCLVGLGLYGLEVPADSGGLELGLGNGVILCEELGRVSAADSYRATALLTDLLPETEILATVPSGDTRAAIVHCGPESWAPRGADAVEVNGRCALADPVDGVDLLVLSTNVEFGIVSVDEPGLTMSADRRPRFTQLTFDAVALRPIRPASRNGDARCPDPALTRARIRQAAYLLGCAEAAHALAAARAARRTQFGQPLGAFQAVAFPLASLLAEVEATRLLVHRAAWLADHGGSAGLASIEALATATELAFAVTRHAMHVHGAFGMTHAAAIYRYYLSVSAEAARWGSAAALWREAAALRFTADIRSAIAP